MKAQVLQFDVLVFNMYLALTKKYSHNLKVESYFIWRECLGLRVRETASQWLWEKRSKKAGGEVLLYTSLQQREQAVLTSKIRYQVKEFSILCMWRCKPLGSLNSFLSYVPQLSGANLVSLFILLPGFSQLLSNHHGGGVWQQFQEPSCPFGGQKSLMVVTCLVY